jgi:hypothetical protein
VAGTGSIERFSTSKVGTVTLTGGCPKPGGILEHQWSAAPACDAACALVSSARACCGTAAAAIRAPAESAAKTYVRRWSVRIGFVMVTSPERPDPDLSPASTKTFPAN